MVEKNKESNKSKNMEGKNKKVTLIMGIVSLLVIIGVGYAFFSGELSNSVRERFSTESEPYVLK